MPPHDKPITLFYSYAHEDEALRDALAQHLSLLKRQGVISGWHDREISAGDEWRGEINAQLENAQIVLLLVSPAFMASDYCYDIELKRSMERHSAGEARVIPVILRPVDWQGAAFGKLQALPKDAKPVTTWENRDEALVDVARGIRLAAERIRADRETGKPPPPLPDVGQEDAMREPAAPPDACTVPAETEAMEAERFPERRPPWIRSVRLRKPLLMGSLVAAIALLLTPALRWADFVMLDLMFAVRGAQAPPEDIVVVAIDDPSFRELDAQWPWPRGIHARLIEALFRAKARVVAFDLLFAQKADDPAQDDLLADAIRRHPGVVLANKYRLARSPAGESFSWIMPSDKLLPAERQSGFINALSPDGVVRAIESRVDGRQALSLSAVQGFLERYAGEQRLALGVIPDEILINYAGPERTIRTVSYYRALDPEAFALGDTFKNKLVFVGLAANALEAERFPTPFTRTGQGLMYGVEIHANAAQNLFDRGFLTAPHPAIASAVSLLLAIASGFFFFNLSPSRSGALAAAVAGLGVTAGFVLFAMYGFALPMVKLLAPTLAVFLASVWYRYTAIYRSEQRIRRILAAQNVRSPDRGRLDGASDSVHVFVSYYDQDEDAKYMAAILDYIQGLNREGVEFWSRRDLITGDARVETIRERIAESDLALVLVSQRYLNCGDCMDIEVREFLSRKLKIFPVILSPCDWQSQPWLRGLTVLPGRGETIAGAFRDRARRDEVLLDVLNDLRKCVKKLLR